MVMRSMRDGASGGFFKYILFGILGMSVGGLVVMDVRGVLGGGGGVSGSDVVRIEDDTISIQDFDRTLRRSLSQYRGITPQQALKIGLTEEILTGQVRTYFLLNEARNIGLKLDKDRMAIRVAEVIKPNMQSGQTMQETLEEMLRYQGMSEGEFIETMQRETYGNLIMQALRLGFQPETKTVAENLYQFQKHTRDVKLIMFPDSAMKDVEPATDEQLKRLYDKVKSVQYKIPEYRTVKVAVFDPTKIDINVNVSDDEVKNYYEDNEDLFAVGEQLILTQALVDDEAQAKQIHELVESGKSLKEAADEVAGANAKYFEKRPFETNAMFPDLLAAIEDVDVGGIAAPVKTVMGHHVVRLDEVVEPTIRSFDEVKDSVKAKLLAEKKDEETYKISEELDEMLDDGETLEAINKSITLDISTINPMNSTGVGKDDTRVIEQFKPADQKDILGIVFELEKGETSLLQELPSGQLAAFVLSNIEEEHFKPYEDVKQELSEQYIKDQKHADNEAMVQKYLAELGTGGLTFEGIAQDNKAEIIKIANVGLEGELEAPLSDAYRPAIFQTDIGEYDVLQFENQFALMTVSGVSIPELTDDAKDGVAELQKKVDQELGDEMFLMYLRKLGDKYPARINRALLEQAYGQREDG